MRMRIIFVYSQFCLHAKRPASEATVGRLFNSGRDLLGLRSHSLSADTMRKFILRTEFKL
ncbi:hypothetical protein V1522DRAFT_406592 [Lipomyces starkeyi]